MITRMGAAVDFLFPCSLLVARSALATLAKFATLPAATAAVEEKTNLRRVMPRGFWFESMQFAPTEDPKRGLLSSALYRFASTLWHLAPSATPAPKKLDCDHLSPH
jgi:hypothetical protein